MLTKRVHFTPSASHDSVCFRRSGMDILKLKQMLSQQLCFWNTDLCKIQHSLRMSSLTTRKTHTQHRGMLKQWSTQLGEAVLIDRLSHFRKVAIIKLIWFLMSREMLSFLSFWDCRFWNNTQPIEHRSHQSES